MRPPEGEFGGGDAYGPSQTSGALRDRRIVVAMAAGDTTLPTRVTVSFTRTTVDTSASQQAITFTANLLRLRCAALAGQESGLERKAVLGSAAAV